ALLALVLLHIGAALWHHLVLRDGLLRRVLPGKRA
ncbi:cytochrome b, partial [Xanthomonas oryzae pv. oryzae]